MFSVHVYKLSKYMYTAIMCTNFFLLSILSIVDLNERAKEKYTVFLNFSLMGPCILITIELKAHVVHNENTPQTLISHQLRVNAICK